MEVSAKNMVNSNRADAIMDIIIQGLESDVKQMKHTAATLSYNVALRCQENSTDVTMQLLSAVCHSLTTQKDLPDDSIVTLLMGLGRLIYKNQDNIELAAAFDVDMKSFLDNPSVKVQAIAKEIDLLLKTPVV